MAAVSDDVLVERLRGLLSEIDMDRTSERMVRAMLEKEFGDLSSRKNLIREQIRKCLEEIHENEGDSDDGDDDYEAEDDAHDEEEDAAAGAADDDDDEEEEEEKPPPPKQRVGKKRKQRGPPPILSTEMQEFLGCESMPRTEITKKLWEYIKENNLQDPANKRNILLDDNLSTLFTSPLNMFSMTKQLSAHISPGVKQARQADRSEEGEGEKRGGGIMKPIKVTTELAEFLGTEEITRPDLTKFMWKYFKSNELQDPSDRRHILCDEKLKALMNVDRFQAFTFMKYLKHHVVP